MFLRAILIRHTCDISLFRRDLPIFEQISQTGISKFTYITYTSPYFKVQISLFEINYFLLFLIILPISKNKSPSLAFHMYVIRRKKNWLRKLMRFLTKMTANLKSGLFHYMHKMAHQGQSVMTKSSPLNNKLLQFMSRHMGIPTICIGENKGADQLCSYRSASQ